MKTQHRHLVILFALLSLCLTANAHVYWDPASPAGSDANDGSSYSKRVKSFERAKELSIAEIGTSNKTWIILCDNSYTISSNTDIDGTTNNPNWPLHIKRNAQYGNEHFFNGNMFEVAAGKTLTLSNIVLDGTGVGNGGAIQYHYCGTLVFLNQGATLTINDGTILQKNHRLNGENDPGSTNTNGGAIESTDGATVIMNGGRITNCRASQYGGGIYLASGSATSDATTSVFTMNDGEIDHCEAYHNQCGGAVYINGKSVTTKINNVTYVTGVYYAQVNLHKGRVHDNYGSIHRTPYKWDAGRGAGIHCSRSIVNMDGDDMEIYNNQTLRYGGGIQMAHGAVLNLSAGKIYNNTAYNDSISPATSVHSGGAGIHISYGISNYIPDGTVASLTSIPSELNMTGGEVYGNKAVNGYGGGIHMSSAAEINLSGGKIHDNEAMYGGAINMQQSRILEFAANSSIEIYNNKAKNGGAVSIDGSPLVIRSGSFHDNIATGTGDYGLGGAFYVHTDNTDNPRPASVEMYGGSVYNNKAEYRGGGFYIKRPTTPALTDQYSDVLIEGGLISGNTANNRGGGIYVNHGHLTVRGSDIVNNTATSSAGGGIYFDATSTMTVGAGNMNIRDNVGMGRPNNIYLMMGNTIAIDPLAVGSSSFNPIYIGVYPQEVENSTEHPNVLPVPVFTGTTTQVSDIYDGMVNGTLHVYDDRQRLSPYISDPADGILYFNDLSPWSPLQQTARASDLGSPVGGYYEISNVKQLTAFLWKVNGIDTHETTFTDPVPNLQGRLTADIDMEGHYWVPIANYEGIFDGNGHIISHLTMSAGNVSTERGMFGVNVSGTIKNVNLRDGIFAKQGNGTIGSIVSKMNGGVLYNCVSQCQLASTISTGGYFATVGGLVGIINGGTMHSSIATCEMRGYTLGGLAGKINSSGNLYNCFANPQFNYSGPDNSSNNHFVGGLVYDNAGTVENCYVRFSRTQSLTNAKFGQLAGQNTGTITDCYTPLNFTSDVPSAIVHTDTGSATSDTYGETMLPVLYNHADNLVSGTNKPLLVTLNNWVKNNGPTTYTSWLRPWQKDNSSKFINDDLPLLRLPATNAVAATNGDANLDYNQVNDLLGAYTTANDAVLFYGAESSMNGNASSAATLYIDKEAVLKQSGTGGAITAYVDVELKNEAPTHYQWHMFSTALQSVPLGVNYTNNNQYAFSWEHPSGMPYWRFYAESDANHGYFPSMTYAYGSANAYNGDNSGAATYGNYYYDWDYYTYFEPHYHWINFKRNSNSHWHEDDSGATKIPYTNETYLGVGKGYFLSVKEDTYLQAHGTLNNGALGSTTPNIYMVTVTDDIAWTNREGFNLVGNPYQSYLDFNAFATANKGLWNNDETKAYYYVIAGNAYVKYAYSASANAFTAPRLVHPHQGFFIVADNADEGGSALTFNDDMRNVTGTGVTFRDSEQPAYPLVNLIVTDDEDKSDIATVELGRPDKGGAKVMANMRVGKGIVYCHYEDEDYAIAFTQPGLIEASIRFETAEDAPFTMTWDTENGEFHYLHLIDNMTGADIDCLTTDEYKFEAKTTDYKSRFRLVFGYTGIDEPEVSEPVEGPTAFAFMMGDELVVNGEGRLQLFDMSGRVLMETQVTGTQSTLGLPELASGIYLLCLGDRINGKRTQKIVIR